MWHIAVIRCHARTVGEIDGIVAAVAVCVPLVELDDVRAEELARFRDSFRVHECQVPSGAVLGGGGNGTPRCES